MNILVISYLFPPCGGGGVDRIHNFVKYLPQYNVIPLVLTVEASYYDAMYLDAKPLEDYHSAVRIFRSKVLLGQYLKNKKNGLLTAIKTSNTTRSGSSLIKDILKSFIIPDEQFTWIKSGFQAANAIIKNHQIDLILSTAPPFSAHVLAGLLARKHDIPLILDYRDLWNSNTFYAGHSIKHTINNWLEKKNIKLANHILVTTEEAKSALCKDFSLDNKKVTIIENGFDYSSIQPYLDSNSTHELNETDQVRILRLNYIGSLTVKRIPDFFLMALQQFVKKYPQYPVEVNFIGYVDATHQSTIRNTGLEDIVKCIGTISKDEALRWMCQKSDVLLVFQRSAEGGSTAIPGKIYEYLSTGKPILTMDENHGATSKLLAQLGLDHTVEFEDVAGIVVQLEKIVLHYDTVKSTYEHKTKNILKYDRKNLTLQLADLIKQYEN